MLKVSLHKEMPKLDFFFAHNFVPFISGDGGVFISMESNDSTELSKVTECQMQTSHCNTI